MHTVKTPHSIRWYEIRAGVLEAVFAGALWQGGRFGAKAACCEFRTRSTVRSYNGTWASVTLCACFGLNVWSLQVQTFSFTVGKFPLLSLSEAETVLGTVV